ncbi:PhnH protein [Candidatus Burkholderia verschuerenii]|uniref:PhnH protein n=2 Tax=Candidatus Burkholderia verschuerenii TaxID=242163 RepID=A0A0L0MKC1_9BURK|nr:PhnH protein [Candidatus Burkholderia verschuerenii]
MQIDMTTLVPGFNDPVHDAQRVFRALLDALARPGSIVSLDAALPANHAMRDGLAGRVPLAAFASLLALTDYSTPVFLARDDRTFGDALRFHASSALTHKRDEAAFVYIDDVSQMPSLDGFAQGEPETPEDAATLFIRVPSLTEGEPLVWRGPGIDEASTVRVAGLSREFWRERAALTAQFPCGIDCYLVAGATLIGLPRTTQVEVN